MDMQALNAEKVAAFLNSHPAVEKVYYLGNLTPADGNKYEARQRQCLSNGAMISFDVVGGEHEAFKVLNALKLIKLAVSLGSTESLAEHPATMTHADVDPAHKIALSITQKMIRISVGVEHYQDIIDDIAQALVTLS
jgi:methionine-gamma-lyase